MSEHRHQQITPGCYRCDLNLDELRDEGEGQDRSEGGER